MKGQQFSIDLDDYTFHCVVTDYTYQAPMGKWADSDYDCWGYEELEWECLCVETYDEYGDLVETTVDIDKYSDRIGEKILDEIHEMQDDVDYDEPDYYY